MRTNNKDHGNPPGLIPNLKHAIAISRLKMLEIVLNRIAAKNHPCAYYSEPPTNRTTNIKSQLSKHNLS